MSRGTFITFEGIEGSGKSTLARRLVSRLGPHATLSREPGGTPLGARIRAILLDSRDLHIAPWAESLLFLADRKQHIDEVIGPELAAGRTVVVDRYIDSSLAYQGAGRGVPEDFIRSTFERMGGVRPDLTVLLDLPVGEALARLRDRGAADRIDSEGAPFHETVRGAFLRLAEMERARFRVVDASGPEDAVWSRIEGLVLPRIEALRNR